VDRRGQHCVGLSLLPPGFLSRLAIDRTGVIGDCAADGFLDG
jgi:hypothetical protein